MFTKSYLVHEYSEKGEYLRNFVVDSRKELVEYLTERKMSYDKNKLSKLGEDLMTIKSKDKTGYVEIEELAEPDDEEVLVGGRPYVSVEEYCELMQYDKQKVMEAIKTGILPCLVNQQRKKFVDSSMLFI